MIETPPTKVTDSKQSPLAHFVTAAVFLNLAAKRLIDDRTPEAFAQLVEAHSSSTRPKPLCCVLHCEGRTGQALGYFHFEDEPGRRSADVRFEATAVIRLRFERDGPAPCGAAPISISASIVDAHARRESDTFISPSRDLPWA